MLHILRGVECSESRHSGGNLNTRHVFPNQGGVHEVLDEVKRLVREVI